MPNFKKRADPEREKGEIGCNDIIKCRRASAETQQDALVTPSERGDLFETRAFSRSRPCIRRGNQLAAGTTDVTATRKA